MQGGHHFFVYPKGCGSSLFSFDKGESCVFARCFAGSYRTHPPEEIRTVPYGHGRGDGRHGGAQGDTPHVLKGGDTISNVPSTFFELVCVPQKSYILREGPHVMHISSPNEIQHFLKQRGSAPSQSPKSCKRRL